MSFLKSPPAPGLPQVMKRAPDVAEPFYLLCEAIMRGPSSFSPGERELIAAYVSALNDCDYCRSSHTAVAEAFGIEPGLVDGLMDDFDGTDVPDKLRAALAYVRTLTETPKRLGQADADAFYAAGNDEEALYDVVMVAALFTMANHIIHGFGIPDQAPEHLALAVERIHGKGYAAAVGFPRRR